MTFAEYCAIDAVNWSKLKLMDESAAAYRYAEQNNREDTDTFIIGRYVHALTLEPGKVGERYAIWRGGRRAGKEWDAFLEAATHDGKVVLREQDMEECHAMAASLRANPDVRAIIDEVGALFEQPVTWTDPGTGLPCKMMGDIICPDSRSLFDLKTAQSIDVRRFGSAIARLGYHGQIAHYTRGIFHHYGWVPKRVGNIVVEKSPPYDCAVFEYEEDVRDAGDEMVTRLMHELAECKATNRWPGRYAAPVPLNSNNLPPWIFGGSGLPDMGFTED